VLEYDDFKQQLIDQIKNATEKCWNCNFCYSKCPLNLSTEGFMKHGPSGLTQSVYYALKWNLLEGSEREEVREELLKMIYSCTTCNNCVLTCKESSAGIPILEIIENSRKLLTENNIGPLPSQRSVLKSIRLKGNPYNYAPEDRFNWLEGKQVKMLPKQQAEVLYYVGCTPSYDSDLQNIPRNIIKILEFLNIDFGLHESEVCCGCSAKRLGDEYLFEELAEKNNKLFAEAGVKTIVTTSPHCYNTFVNEYKHNKNLEILHYTQFLAQKMKHTNIKESKSLNYVVAYHDPCYLSKHNEVYIEPREIIQSIKGVKLVEMEYHGKDSLCCGGGGGRMWAEVEEENRLNESRIEQALAAGANVLAVACPWCYTMLRDAVKNLEYKDKIKVMDITELLIEAWNL